MKTALRLALLALCAAAGIGVAAVLALGLTSSAPQEARPAPLSPMRSNLLPPVLEFPDVAEARSETFHREPLAARPYPRVAQEFTSDLPDAPSPNPLRLVVAPAPSPMGTPPAPAPSGLNDLLLNAGQMMQQNPQVFQQMLGNPQVQQMLNNPQGMEQMLKALQGTPPALAPALGTAQSPAPGALPPPANAALAPVVEPLPPTTPKSVFSHAEGDDRLTMTAQNEDLRKVLEDLSEQGNLNILCSNSVKGTVSASLKDVDVNSALDAILRSTGFISKREGKFIYVGTPEDFAAMQTALDTLGTRVYRPNYVPAKELQALITPLITPTTGKISVTSAAAVGIAVDETNAGGDSFAAGEAVMVQDYEAVLSQIDQVVREIDQKPLQVAIEAMILQVDLNDQTKFGINLQFLRGDQGARLGVGEFGAAPVNGADTQVGATGTVSPFTVGDAGGVRFVYLNGSVAALIRLLETIGDTNVIATPRLMCLNKQRAEILIGKQQGYITTTTTQTFATQTVQFLDSGTQLRLRPFISGDGMVRLEVHPELSDGTVSDKGIPSKTLTQVTTNIMCPDGATVIIGGLMKEQLKTDSSQIPVLGSMPVIGFMFRNRTETIARTETLVLLTPRIVHDQAAEAEALKGMNDAEQRQATVGERLTKFSRTSISRKYFNKSKEALANGRIKHGKKYAELAVVFDPNNMEAIKHRDSFDEGTPAARFSRLQPGPDAAPGDVSSPQNPLDGEVLPPWLLKRLEGLNDPTDLPQNTHDTGTPGYIRKLTPPKGADVDQR